MRRLSAVVSLLAALVALTPALAGAAPATWSLNRASFGFDATAAQWTHQGQNASSFLPGSYLSYSLTSGLTLAGTVQRDFARSCTIGKAGARFKVLSFERGAVYVGGNLVGYGDQVAWLGIKKPTSFESTVNGAYDLAQSAGRTTLFGLVGASWDQANDVKELKVGLRWQAVGGLFAAQ